MFLIRFKKDPSAVPQETMDKIAAWEKHPFDVVFVGDDWKGTETWNKLEADFGARGADVVYFPYTAGTSSTLLAEKLTKL